MYSIEVGLYRGDPRRPVETGGRTYASRRPPEEFTIAELLGLLSNPVRPVPGDVLRANLKQNGQIIERFEHSF